MGLGLPAAAATRDGRRGGRTAGHTDDRLRFFWCALAAAAASRRRRGATAGSAAACRSLPPVARGAVLHHARVRAHRIAAQILLPRVAVVLAVLQRRVADLDQRVLV